MARIVFSDAVVDVPPGITVEDAGRGAGLTPDSYIYLVGGVPVPMDSVPSDDGEVRAIRVASGG
ncbi:hypothetical protein [Candidatus Methanoprimaticola sp. MG2]|uniref:hypothetical protein n=1 Tax=Candidatus Methanoprimaticola sp. MG2 TaxID=3228838 RepID=UPI0039C5F9E5